MNPVDAVNRMDQAPEPRFRWWRFSLRELLLVMVATGAFSGWGVLLYERFQRFEPTAFYLERIEWQHESIAPALRDVGEEATVHLACTSTQTLGPSAAQSTTAYRIRLSAANNGAFIQALEARISE